MPHNDAETKWLYDFDPDAPATPSLIATPTIATPTVAPPTIAPPTIDADHAAAATPRGRPGRYHKLLSMWGLVVLAIVFITAYCWEHPHPPRPFPSPRPVSVDLSSLANASAYLQTTDMVFIVGSPLDSPASGGFSIDLTKHQRDIRSYFRQVEPATKVGPHCFVSALHDFIYSTSQGAQHAERIEGATLELIRCMQAFNTSRTRVAGSADLARREIGTARHNLHDGRRRGIDWFRRSGFGHDAARHFDEKVEAVNAALALCDNEVDAVFQRLEDDDEYWAKVGQRLSALQTGLSSERSARQVYIDSGSLAQDAVELFVAFESSDGGLVLPGYLQALSQDGRLGCAPCKWLSSALVSAVRRCSQWAHEK
ncbi:hypothetical protein LTR74_003357 [Friedmanniomyces endolithicus]|nr:hypothetical protein LTR74_003357 [Friedmanniomyces endolithicus]